MNEQDTTISLGRAAQLAIEGALKSMKVGQGLQVEVLNTSFPIQEPSKKMMTLDVNTGLVKLYDESGNLIID